MVADRESRLRPHPGSRRFCLSGGTVWCSLVTQWGGEFLGQDRGSEELREAPGNWGAHSREWGLLLGVGRVFS